MLRAGAIAAALAVACAGCGGGKETTTEAKTTGGTTRPPGCPYLVARLQRATLAIRSSAELVARSKNKTQLVKRIGIEQQQLERSAALVATGPTPASLVPATKRLAAALHALSVDFSKAKKPAAAGNYPAAARLMADRTLQLRIVRESQAIARGCT